MYETNADSSQMTPGHMLLMGFAGMFSRLDADFAALVEAVSAVHTVDKYKKADLVREAAMLQVTAVLEYDYFLWYFETFLLHCALSLAVQCIVISPVCVFAMGGRCAFVGV